jgi:hypothetical protein
VAQPGIAFDVLNPRVIEAVRTLESRVMVGLTEDLRATVRQHIEAGLREGLGTPAIAQELRDVLALAPNQEEAVRNFRAMLEEGDPEALSRALRDRRFDASIRRAFNAEGGKRKLPGTLTLRRSIAGVPTMAGAEAGASVHVEMSQFPGWQWEVVGPGGGSVARFKTDEALQSWLARHTEEGGGGTVSGLSEAQIDTMTAAYQRKMVAFNADTHAQTAVRDALKEGQRLSWQQAVDKGLIDGGRLRKQWAAVAGPGGDGRNRPEHLAMHGETVPADQPFSNGEMTPGADSWNCRCVALYFLARAEERAT